MFLLPSVSRTIRTSRTGVVVGTRFLSEKAGGIGLNNVKDRVAVTSRRDSQPLFRFTPNKTCCVIGAPMTYGQPYVGTDAGPQELRDAGLRSKLSALDWRVKDLGDLDFDAAVSSSNVEDDSSFKGNARNPLKVGAGSEKLAKVVHDTLEAGQFPLILGGDHSIGIGSLAGILKARPDTGILWIDAHADLNTPIMSESGNMHGMPVGFLMLGAKGVPGLSWLSDYPMLKPEQIVYVGLRDVDPAERDCIHEHGISAYTMTEIDRYGIGQVMKMALNDLRERPLHLSYDIDAVDPVLAPATGTAVRGGLNFREAHYVAEAVARSGRLASAEIVELNPTLSNDEGADDTIELGLQIITSLMGKSII